jgi:preprotein translocase subunit SecD
MTASGAEKLQRVTESHIGAQLAIVLDDTVLMAPRIASAIKTSVAIDLNSATDAEFQEINRKIALALSALPDEQAATKP